LRHTPRLLRRYRVRQAVQFLACQSWYTLWSLSLAVLWSAPTVALVLQQPIAAVSVGRFLLFFLPLPLMSLLMWLWSRPWFQPAGLRLSWRGVLLEIARWPVVLWALVNVVLNVKRSYMITPKGVGRRTGPGLSSIYGPYLVMTLVPLAALWGDALANGRAGLPGYYGLALFNAAFGLALLVTTLAIEFRAAAVLGTRTKEALRARAAILAAAGSALVAFAASVTIYWHPVLAAFG
jgi:cellulose synthase (UDP-forming)